MGFRVCVTVFTCLWRRCLAPDVWLAPLADRLVRLVLQLLARYATWLQAGLEARSSAAYSTDPAQSGQVMRSASGCAWNPIPSKGLGFRVRF